MKLLLPPQQVSSDVLLEKYAKHGESTQEEIFRRVAIGIAQAEKSDELKTYWENEFFVNMTRGALGAGRIMSAAGTSISATLANCFVQPVGDCIQGLDANGFPGIFDALREAAETMRRGGGVGYDFSRIRPKGALVKGTASYASGPCSYIDVFDVSCKTVESAGSRRGAQMGVLRIDHPDIVEFITAKRTKGRWNNFNVSVGVPDEFMEVLAADGYWELVHESKGPGNQAQRSDGKWVYAMVRARELWDTVMKSCYAFAEPGVLFLSKMNRDNNLRYIEIIEACNPCGEQPLPAYACCDLGPIILPWFVLEPFRIQAEFDWDAFKRAVRTQVRFLDNVLDVSYWPLEAQKIEAHAKRRIGVGFTGLGNSIAMLGLSYKGRNGRSFAAKVAEVMRDTAYEASVDLAIEKGSFPKFDCAKFLESGTFASRLPEAIKDRIREHGTRNSHLLSIAPVGTVSLGFADNTSNGVEPPFALAYNRVKRLAGGGETTYAVLDHGLRVFLETVCAEEKRAPLLDAVVHYRDTFDVAGTTFRVADELPVRMETALEMSAQEHLEMMVAIQPFIDTAISKTVNIPADYPFEEFADLYVSAWKGGLKGLATYRPNDVLGSVLSVGVQTPTKTAPAVTSVVNDVDPQKVVIEKRPEGDCESVSTRIEYITERGSVKAYVIVSFAKVDGVIDGKPVTIERPLEVFVPGIDNDVPQEWVALFSRQISLSARRGFIDLALKDSRQLKSDRGRVRFGWHVKPDGTKVPRFHDSEVGALAYAIQQILLKRGYMDAEGNVIPSRILAVKREGTANLPPLEVLVTVCGDQNDALKPGMMAGKKCEECGAHAVIKSDGCERCTSCGSIGSCG